MNKKEKLTWSNTFNDWIRNRPMELISLDEDFNTIKIKWDWKRSATEDWCTHCGTYYHIWSMGYHVSGGCLK